MSSFSDTDVSGELEDERGNKDDEDVLEHTFLEIAGGKSDGVD